MTRSVADQLTPILRLHGEVYASVRPVVDTTVARQRLARGRAGFDAVGLLSRTRSLAAPYERAIDAFEVAGLASTSLVAAVRTGGFDARMLAIAWASGDGQPTSAINRLARRIAGVVANAVLRRNARAISTTGSVTTWSNTICPCCGGSPDMAIVDTEGRTLVCARCDTSWTTTSLGCLGCGATTTPAVVRVRSSYLGYDLVVCNACGRYLKERTGALAHDPLLERALTAEIDAAAEMRGLRI